ncbi:hypothetical protein H0H92_013450 [Tricholoma furcatifolium]|nr:hypothetical protein H0H92_013450 [Tricholoma furcatifolium]
MKGFFQRIQDSRSGTRKPKNDPSAYQVWLPPAVNNDNPTHRGQPEPLNSTDHGDNSHRATQKGSVPRPPEFNYEPGTVSSSYNYSTYPSSGRGYAYVRTTSTPTAVQSYPYPNEHASVPILLPPQTHTSREPPHRMPMLPDHNIRRRRERSDDEHPSDRDRKHRFREEDVDLVQPKIRNVEKHLGDVGYSRHMERQLDQKRELEEGREPTRKARKDKEKRDEDTGRRVMGEARDRERRHREREEDRRDVADPGDRERRDRERRDRERRDRERRDRNDRGGLEERRKKDEDHTRVRRDRGGQKTDREIDAVDRRDRKERKERTRESDREEVGGKELSRSKGKDRTREREREVEIRETRDVGRERRGGRDHGQERERETPWEQRIHEGRREMRETDLLDSQGKTRVREDGAKEQDDDRKASAFVADKPRMQRERIGESNRRADTQKDSERQAESIPHNDAVGLSDQREHKRKGRKDRYDYLDRRYEPERSAWGYATAVSSQSHAQARLNQPIAHEETTSDSSPRRQLPKSSSKHKNEARLDTSAPPDPVTARQPPFSSSTDDQPARQLANPSTVPLGQHGNGASITVQQSSRLGLSLPDNSTTDASRENEHQIAAIQASTGVQHSLPTATTPAYKSQPSYEMVYIILIVVLCIPKMYYGSSVQKPPFSPPETIGAEQADKRTDRAQGSSTFKTAAEKQHASSRSIPSAIAPQIDRTGHSTVPQSSRLPSHSGPVQPILLSNLNNPTVQLAAPPLKTDQLPQLQIQHQASSTMPQYLSGTPLVVDVPSRKRTESSASKDFVPLVGQNTSRHLNNLVQPENQTFLPRETMPNVELYRLESIATEPPLSQQNTPHVGLKSTALQVPVVPLLKQPSTTESTEHTAKENSQIPITGRATEPDFKVAAGAFLQHEQPEVSKLTPPKGGAMDIFTSKETRSNESSRNIALSQHQLQGAEEQVLVDKHINLEQPSQVAVRKASLDAKLRQQEQPSHFDHSTLEVLTAPNIIQTPSFATEPVSVNPRSQELPMDIIRSAQSSAVNQLPPKTIEIRPPYQDKIDKPETARSRLPSMPQSTSQGSEGQVYGNSRYLSTDRMPLVALSSQSSSYPSNPPLYAPSNQIVNHAPLVMRMPSETPLTAMQSIPTMYHEHRHEFDISAAAISAPASSSSRPIDAQASTFASTNAEGLARHPNTTSVSHSRDDGKSSTDQQNPSSSNIQVSKLVAEYEARSTAEQTRTNPSFHIPRSSTSLGHRQASGERGFLPAIEPREYLPFPMGLSQGTEKAMLASTIERPATSLGSRIHRIDKSRFYDPKPGVQFRPSIAPQFQQSVSGGYSAPAPSAPVLPEPTTRPATQQATYIPRPGDEGPGDFKSGILEALPVKHGPGESSLNSEDRTKDLHKPDLNSTAYRTEQPTLNKQADLPAHSPAATGASSLDTPGIVLALHRAIGSSPEPLLDKVNNVSIEEADVQPHNTNDSTSRLHRRELSVPLVTQERPKDNLVSSSSLIQNAQLAELLSNTPSSHEVISTSTNFAEPNPTLTAPQPPTVLHKAHQIPERFPDEFGSRAYAVQKSPAVTAAADNLTSVLRSRESPPSRTLEAHLDPQKFLAFHGEAAGPASSFTVQRTRTSSQAHNTASLWGSEDKTGVRTHAAEASFPNSDPVQGLPQTVSRSKDPSKGSNKPAPAIQSSSFQSVPAGQSNLSHTNLPLTIAAETSSSHPPQAGPSTRYNDHQSSHKALPVISGYNPSHTTLSLTVATETPSSFQPQAALGTRNHDHHQSSHKVVPAITSSLVGGSNPSHINLPIAVSAETSSNYQPQASLNARSHHQPYHKAVAPIASSTHPPTSTSRATTTQRIEHTRHRSQHVPISNNPSTSQVDLATRQFSLPSSQASHALQAAPVPILPHNEPLYADPSSASTRNHNVPARTVVPVHNSESRPYYNGASTIQPTTSTSQTRPPVSTTNISRSRLDATLQPPTSTIVSSNVLRKPSQDSFLLQTPSSLAPTLLKPTVSQTSIPASFSSQISLRKRGLFGLFKSKAKQPPEEPQKSIIQETRKEPKKKIDKQKEQPSQAVNVHQSKPAAQTVMQPTPDTNQNKVFTPFRYLTTKRNRRVSAASLEAQDGTASNTIMGSPTASMHSTQPPTIHSPPLRDVFAATQEWRHMEAAEMRELTGGKLRRARPGVVFDVAENPNEERRKKIKPQSRHN